MSSTKANLEEYQIPLEEILLATHNLNRKAILVDGSSGVIYRGQLSERWQNRRVALTRLHPHEYFGQPEFLNMVDLMSRLNHKNIIHFIGYEASEMITVSEYANNQSLFEHLNKSDKRRSLTWAQRLKICLGAASGLEYLHSGLGEGRSVIHRNIKPEKILLDENLEAKISSFNMSILVDQNQPPEESDIIGGTDFYTDPLYKEGGVVQTEVDVYSFGVVLFEVLSGMHAYNTRSVGGDQKQALISLVRRYYDDGLDNLIDPFIRDHIHIRSFRVFKKIAYQCISWNMKERPTMNTIVKRIQEALDIQNHEAASTITASSHQHQSLESFVMSLEEILLATDDFNVEKAIDGNLNLYKGKLSKKWQNRTAAFKCYDKDTSQQKKEFLNELTMVSAGFHHENVIRFIGYCDEGNPLVIVYDYPINGSLVQHINKPEFNERHCLSWAKRLQICLGAARGLEYLHSCVGENIRVIHRDIKSLNILLDVNLEAKITDFSLSLIVDRNQQQVYDVPARSSYYRDPIYEESGLVNTKSDIYSFGVVMLETLTGMPAFKRMTIDDDWPQSLVNLVRHYYDHGLDILINPFISHEVNIHSFRVFMKTLRQCISLKLEDRPTMKRVIKRIQEAQDFQKHEGGPAMTTQSGQHKNLEEFRISLEEINLAIKDFSLETPVGAGGFGKVYRAKLQNREVAIKHLNPEAHHGKEKFLNEVELISKFDHRNIISFVGYCDEDDKMIIVSKYAINGSLEDHLRDESKKKLLTWKQRLNICLGGAKGLECLHSRLGKDNGVIHRDVKSGNILLDENMEAKICDFGLSKQDPGNQQHTQVYTKVVGTMNYVDPLYRETKVLRKESDVYSFGVVMFEMLSGKLAYCRQPLISLVRRYYKDDPQILIDPSIRDEIDNACFHMFIEIAYRCISLNSEERPTMDTIINGIEDAIDLQEHEV